MLTSCYPIFSELPAKLTIWKLRASIWTLFIPNLMFPLRHEQKQSHFHTGLLLCHLEKTTNIYWLEQNVTKGGKKDNRLRERPCVLSAPPLCPWSSVWESASCWNDAYSKTEALINSCVVCWKYVQHFHSLSDIFGPPLETCYWGLKASYYVMWACPYGSHLYTHYFTQKWVLLK